MRISDLSFRLWKSETALETAGGCPFPSPALSGSGSMGQRSLLSLMAPQRIAATRIAGAIDQDNLIRHPKINR